MPIHNALRNILEETNNFLGSLFTKESPWLFSFSKSGSYDLSREDRRTLNKLNHILDQSRSNYSFLEVSTTRMIKVFSEAQKNHVGNCGEYAQAAVLLLSAKLGPHLTSVDYLCGHNGENHCFLILNKPADIKFAELLDLNEQLKNEIVIYDPLMRDFYCIDDIPILFKYGSGNRYELEWANFTSAFREHLKPFFATLMRMANLHALTCKESHAYLSDHYRVESGRVPQEFSAIHSTLFREREFSGEDQLSHLCHPVRRHGIHL